MMARKPEIERPSCSLRYPPQDLIVASAARAVELNPVNAPMVPHAVMASMPGPDPALFLALITTKYWGAEPRTLTVQFVETTGRALQDKILQYMNAWSRSGCIQFKKTGGQGVIRIGRGGQGYWSYLGTDVTMIPPDQPTMNLQGFVLKTPESEYSRVVIHETGHSLGFPHEHMRSEFVRNIDPRKAIPFFQRTYGWPPALTEQNVLTPLDDRTLMGTPPDQDSIMAYQLPGAIMRDGRPVRGGTRLTASDEKFNGRVYPKAGAGRDVA